MEIWKINKKIVADLWKFRKINKSKKIDRHARDMLVNFFVYKDAEKSCFSRKKENVKTIVQKRNVSK